MLCRCFRRGILPRTARLRSPGSIILLPLGARLVIRDLLLNHLPHQRLRLVHPPHLLQREAPRASGAQDHRPSVVLAPPLLGNVIAPQILGDLVMPVRLIEIARPRLGVADVDVDGVSLPVDAGAAGFALEDGEDSLVGDSGFGFVSDGGEGVAALEEGGAHAELGDAEGEEFQGGGVGEAGGGGVFFVFWIEDGIVFGLQLHLITIPEPWPGNLNRLIRTPQRLLGPLLPRLRQLPLTQLAQTQTRTRRLPQQQTQPQRRPRLRQPIRAMLHRRIVLVQHILIHVNFARSLVLAIVVLREEELGQADLLFPSRHLGHGTARGAGEEVGLEGREVFVLAAFASLDRVFEVDEEAEIGDSAVVVAIFAENFEAGAGEGRFV
mmetsp:Transcript_24029/g.43231  ORF Transcript_24029/g.43231 Transcript_24029/m.43231 type:complete len:380 (+) Transcript_24029:334-1473(+)